MENEILIKGSREICGYNARLEYARNHCAICGIVKIQRKDLDKHLAFFKTLKGYLTFENSKIDSTCEIYYGTGKMTYIKCLEIIDIIRTFNRGMGIRYYPKIQYMLEEIELEAFYKLEKEHEEWENEMRNAINWSGTCEYDERAITFLTRIANTLAITHCIRINKEANSIEAEFLIPSTNKDKFYKALDFFETETTREDTEDYSYLDTF